ncbi:MAG: Gfo/Idh/MocA family oxidoreductase [Planctomycetaceae bacterium]|jgi:predicted dehydrogenase
MLEIDRRGFVTAAGMLAAGFSIARANAAPERIKIGQIGTGHAHASGVFSQLKKTDDFEVVGIVENNPERRQALGDSYQNVQLISEEQLLNTKDLRAVVVETEVEELLPTAKRCAAAGLHIHLDKPAGENIAGFRSLLQEMERRKLHLQMGYIYRYHTAFQFCYRIVEEGWLGDVFELHAVMSKKVDASSRKYLSRYAGGSMFEIGCHVVDAMVRVMGTPQKCSAFSRRTHPDQDPLVDNQLAVFDYPTAIASIRSALVEYEGFQRRQFTVCGEFGTFDLRPLGGDSFRLALEHPRDTYRKGYQDVTIPKGPGVFISAFRDMAAILRDEKETDYPLSHELAVHEATLRASGYDVQGES